MTKRLGDLPAWVSIVFAIVTTLLATGAAWGVAGNRIFSHDAEIAQLRAVLVDMNTRLSRIEGALRERR